MIGWWGFQIVEPPRASSGSARIQRSLSAEKRKALAIENTQPARMAPSRRSRSPPGYPEAERHHQSPDMTLGQRRPPPAQANQSPPESTTERSQL